jgi:NitT/TauT family transport system substrate-binding protein
MKHMPYAAQEMADFMVNVGFIPQKSDDLSSIFNDSFVKTYAEKQE